MELKPLAFYKRKTGSALVATLTVFLTASLTSGMQPLSAAPAPGQTVSPFASQIVWPDNTYLAEYAGHLQTAGVQVARSELIWWGLCEQTTGTYNFRVGAWDCSKWLATLKARGISPYVILCYSNPLYGGTPDTPEGRAGFAKFCQALVTRYRDDVDIWEIWNEPNLEMFWGKASDAAAYSALVAAAAPVIRAADPGCVIVGGATSGIDQTFLAACLQLGMLQYVDVVSVHPYRIDRPESINSEIAVLRAAMNAQPGGSAKRIWTGEWGYNAGWSEIDETGQAKMLARMMVNNPSQGIELSVWFSVHGWADTEDWGLTNLALQPRASHQALKVVNQQLPLPVARITKPFSLSFNPSRSRYRSEVFEHGGVSHRTLALWNALDITATGAPSVTDITAGLTSETRLSAWDGLSGDETALDARWDLPNAKVLFSKFSMRDYPIYIKLDRETLPTGFRLGRAAMTSITADSQYAPGATELAFDGLVSAASKWTSANSAPPHWLACQFGKTYRLTGFALRLPSMAGEMASYNAQAVEFQTAPSMAGPWTTAAAAANPLNHDRIISILPAPLDAACARLVVTRAGIDNYARIQEFEIYASGAVPPAGIGAFEAFAQKEQLSPGTPDPAD